MPSCASCCTTFKTSPTVSGIEVRAVRLVEQHRARGWHRCERPGDGDALLCWPPDNGAPAARRPCRQASTLARNSRARASTLSRGMRRTVRVPASLTLDSVRGHVREEFKTLEHHADLAADLARLASFDADLCDRQPVDAAAVDRLQAVDATKQRRLARTAWPDDADDLAFVREERHASQCLDACRIAAEDVFDIDQRRFVVGVPPAIVAVVAPGFGAAIGVVVHRIVVHWMSITGGCLSLGHSLIRLRR